MNMLCQCELKLTPRQSAELLWNRFVNVHGLPGRNISSDLHQERVCKDAVQGLGQKNQLDELERLLAHCLLFLINMIR